MATLLAILTAVAQVLGPLACTCCGPVVVATAVVAPTAVEPACPHCRHAEPESPPAESCPVDCPPRECCWSVPTVAIVPAETLDAIPSTAADAQPVIAFAGAAPALDLTPWRAAASDLPFLTTSARLYAHHALRC